MNVSMQDVITADLTVDERAVLLAYMLDKSGAFRWKAIGAATGQTKKEVLAVRDSLLAQGCLGEECHGYWGLTYEITLPVKTF